MEALIGILGLFGFLLSLLMMGISFFKKNGKAKKYGIGAIATFVMFIGAMVASPETPKDTAAFKQNVSLTGNSQDAKTTETKPAETASPSTVPGSSTNTETKNAVNNKLQLHFINVGQADSILVVDNGKSMLIDAGNNSDSDTVINYIKAQGITKLDVVVGTHAHEDHIGGMDKVISSFEIGSVYLPKQQTNTKTFEDVLTAIKNKGIKITAPVPGTVFKLNQAEAFILAPNSSSYEDINNSSIALRLTFGSNHFMLMGDAEDVSEKEILGKNFNLSADLLKVGHHGSSSSTSTEFINKVSPKYAVISVGKGNTYGHPTKDTMDKLKARGIKVYRTDENGTIVATSDGTNITFNTKEGSYSYASVSSGSNNSSVSANTSSGSTAPASTAAQTPAPTPSVTPAPAPYTNNSRTVFYTPSGKSYHYDKNCRTLARSKTILSQTLAEALTSDHADPCDVCVH